jgi:hypothetical protein
MVGFRSRMLAWVSLLPNQLAIDKCFAMYCSRAAGYSGLRTAQALGVSRGTVRRHLQPTSQAAPRFGRQVLVGPAIHQGAG